MTSVRFAKRSILIGTLAGLAAPAAVMAQTEAPFVLQDVRFIGSAGVDHSQLLTEKEEAAVAAPYKGRHVAEADIVMLSQDVTLALIKKGFVNSGAVVTNIDRKSGLVTLDLKAGKLIAVNVPPDLKYLTRTYFSERFNESGNKPLNINQLNLNFQLMLEDPNIDHLDAHLQPGKVPGEAELNLSIREKPRDGVSFVVANDRSPAVGATRIGLSARHAALFTPGDTAFADVSRTAGLTEVGGTYTTPINARDWKWTLYAQASKAKVVNAPVPLSALDAISTAFSTGTNLRVPLVNRPGNHLSLSAGLTYTRVVTDLLGQPFSFSAGAINGVTAYSAGQMGLNWTYFSNKRAIWLSATVTQGLAGASRITGVDRNFTHFDLSGQYTLRLNDLNQRLILKGASRFSGSRTYAVEMLTIGGPDTVRGYRQNLLLGDKGYWASAEYLMPLDSLVRPKPTAKSSWLPRDMQFGLFIDTGNVRSNALGAPRQGALLSAGGHLIYNPIKGVKLEAYAAAPLNKKSYIGSYADRGLGFKLSYDF